MTCRPCNGNPELVGSPEYGKAYKLENNSQLGRGTNIDVARYPKPIEEPRVIRTKKTRQDYI